MYNSKTISADMIKKEKGFFKSIGFKNKVAFNIRYVFEHFFGVSFVKRILRKWDKKIQSDIFNSINDIERKRIPVKEFDSSVDPHYLRNEYVKKGIPVVIRKGATKWKAFKNWDFSFFKEEYGNHPVLLTNHKDLGDDGTATTTSSLKEIIEGIDQDSMKYARFNPLLDTYPELQKDLDQTWLDKVRNTKLMKHHVLFLGNKGTKTNIHNAGNENIFVQIRGKKRWLLWDQDAHYVFNPTVNRAPAKASPIDPNKKKQSKNPAFNHLPYYELILEPGDIIYIPSYLWHYVENLTPTIGIGNRWLSPINTVKNNPLFACLELFNTSPSIFSTMDWRKEFDFNKIMMKNRGR